MKPEDLNPVRNALSSIHKSVKRRSQKLFRPFKYSLKGKEFCSSPCDNRFFHETKGQANTSFMSLFGLDWLDAQMTILVCSDCGLVFWMSDRPQKVE